MFNWGKTVKYNENIINAENINDLIKIAKRGKYTIMGGGHSFIDIYGGGPLVNIAKINKILDIDLKNNTVTAEAGIKVKDLEDFLKPYKRVLLSVGSIREQTLAGMASNCVNSLGGNYITHFCDVIVEITYINNEGNIKKIHGKELKYYSVHLGSICGLIYSIKVKISDKTYCKYYDDYVNINRIQDYINTILQSKTPKLCEFIYFYNNPTVAVLMAEPFKDKTNIDETLIPSNSDHTEIVKNKNTKFNDCPIKKAQHFSKLVNKHGSNGMKYINRFRNNIHDGENIAHYSKLWFRGGVKVTEPVTYMEFYVPVDYLKKIIDILLKMNIDKISYYIQIRPFLKSKYLLCPSYNENVASILFSTYLKNMENNRYIIDILNFIGVRWHWGEALDMCIYDGYIERVYSNKVRDEIEKRIVNKQNMRPQFERAIKHVSDYKEDWKKMVGKNLNLLKCH